MLSIKNDHKFYIGVLSINKNGMCTPQLTSKKEINERLAKSDIIEINLTKKYKGREFLEELERKLRKDFLTRYRNARTSIWGSYLQIRLFPNTHYEVYFSRNKKIGIGLHIEAGKNITERIFASLEKKENEIKKILGKDIFFDGRWGKGWTTGNGSYWARIYEEMERKKLDEQFAKEVLERIKLYIETIQPQLENASR